MRPIHERAQRKATHQLVSFHSDGSEQWLPFSKFNRIEGLPLVPSVQVGAKTGATYNELGRPEQYTLPPSDDLPVSARGEGEGRSSNVPFTGEPGATALSHARARRQRNDATVSDTCVRSSECIEHGGCAKCFPGDSGVSPGPDVSASGGSAKRFVLTFVEDLDLFCSTSCHNNNPRSTPHHSLLHHSK
jgi:hypothetical protein